METISALRLRKSRKVRSGFARKTARILIILLLVAASILPALLPDQAHAAAATGYLRLDRMKINTTTGGVVCFNPTASETTVRKMDISFADGSGTGGAASFAVNSTGANWTWDTTAANLPAGVTAFPGTAAASTVSTGAVTFVVTADQSLTAGTTYCLHFTGTSTLTTPTSANGSLTGTINLRNTGGTVLTSETVNYATASVSNDQIAVTATVPATFSFALGSNTAALSTLSTASVTSATGITLTVSTNANNGWTAWLKSLNGNLTSASTSDTITAGTYTSGSGNIADLASVTGYVVDADITTGTPTIAVEYDGNTVNKGGKLDTNFEKLASNTTAVSGNVVTLLVRAKPTATNKAASDYADTLTVTGAGQF